MRKILVIYAVFLLFGISSAFADTQDLNGYWIIDEINYKGISISENALYDQEKTKNYFPIVLEIEKDGSCRVLVGRIVYSASIKDNLQGQYELSIAEDNFVFNISNDNTLVFSITGDITFLLEKSEKVPDFSVATKIEDIIAADEREEELRKEIEAAKAIVMAAIKPASVYEMEVFFSEKDTQEMSNYINYGRYYINNNTMIGMAYDKSGFLPNLVKSNILIEGNTRTQEVFTVLDRHVNANFLTEYQDQLYYVRVDRDSGLSTLARLNLKTDQVSIIGNEMHEMAYLQIHDSRLWYTGDEHRLYSCMLNGKDNRIEIDKSVYDPYFLTEDWIIYQDDKDGETLHIRCIKDGTDLKITSSRSFNPIVVGSTLFFTSIPDNGGKAYLSKADLSKPFKEGDMCFRIEKSDLPMSKSFYIIDSVIYGENNSLSSINNWRELTNSAWHEITKRIFYIGESYMIYGEMYPEHATVSYLCLCSRETGEISYFRHVY